jgi:hypothetical protein
MNPSHSLLASLPGVSSKNFRFSFDFLFCPSGINPMTYSRKDVGRKFAFAVKSFGNRISGYRFSKISCILHFSTASPHGIYTLHLIRSHISDVLCPFSFVHSFACHHLTDRLAEIKFIAASEKQSMEAPA